MICSAIRHFSCALIAGAMLVCTSSAVAREGPVATKLRTLGEAVAVPTFRPRGQKLPNLATKPQTSNKTSTCMAKLQTIARIRPAVSPRVKDTGCKIPEPVELISTRAPDSVEFTGRPLLDCAFALALTRYTLQTLQPNARKQLGKSLMAVVSGPGFQCRRRNRAKTGKLSEHAFGGAIDLVGFQFSDKTRLQIAASDQLKRRDAEFLNVVRQKACSVFTTVLGPGSNAAHATHLHLDLGRSKGRKNPYRICQ